MDKTRAGTAPLRKIVDRGQDKHGAFHILECGHHVEANRAETARRCPRCAPVPRPQKEPVGPVALRRWMAEHYGWPNKSVKDIEKLSSWCIDDLGEERRKVYPTSCPLHVQVKDDETLVLSVGNDEIRARVAQILSASAERAAWYELRYPFRPGLESIASAIEVLVRNPYDVPSFKYVCPQTAARLRSFAGELGTYVPPALG